LPAAAPLYPLPLHDALPILAAQAYRRGAPRTPRLPQPRTPSQALHRGVHRDPEDGARGRLPPSEALDRRRDRLSADAAHRPEDRTRPTGRRAGACCRAFQAPPTGGREAYRAPQALKHWTTEENLEWGEIPVPVEKWTPRSAWRWLQYQLRRHTGVPSGLRENEAKAKPRRQPAKGERR